jgi:hypothetical protein
MESKVERRCPSCGYAYEQWVETCPDCGVPLVQGGEGVRKERPSLDPGEDPKWTVVTNAPNAILGSFIKSQLEDAGIPVLMYRSRSADVGEFSHNDYVPHDLRVPKSMWEEARAIVDGRPNVSGPEGTVSSYLPQGWSLITGMGTYREYEESTPSEDAEDGERPSWRVYRVDGEGNTPGSYLDQGGSSYPPLNQREEEEAFQDSDYADEPIADQKWVKLFYAILLLAISLPFLLQLFAQLARILQP